MFKYVCKKSLFLSLLLSLYIYIYIYFTNVIFFITRVAEFGGKHTDVLLRGTEVRHTLHVEEDLPARVLDLLEKIDLLLHSSTLAAHQTHNPRGLCVEEKDLHPAHLGAREHTHHVALFSINDVHCHFFVL